MPDAYDNFCAAVTGRIKHATAEEKRDIAAELRAHMEDHAEALVASGWDEAEAQSSAVASMGQAEGIGEALSREYPLHLLIISRAAGIIAGILIASMALFSILIVPNVVANIRARVSPPSRRPAGAVTYRELDVRQRVGNDMLYIYEAGTARMEDGRLAAYVCMSNYDINPFGIASQSVISNVEIYANNSEPLPPDYEGSGRGAWPLIWSGGGNSGALNFCRGVEAGTDGMLYLSYDRFGCSFSLEVPVE